MCAAVYIFGKYGDNTCPENTVQIGSAEACARAAIFMGLVPPSGDFDPQYDQPRGCFHDKWVSAYYRFNRTWPDERPLCAVGMSSSHSRAPYRAAWYKQRTRSMPRH